MLPRNKKKKYDRDFVIVGLNRDYLGPTPLFDGKEFDTMFRISRSRFQRILEDVGNAEIPFYTQITDMFGNQGPCMEARLLLALKTMAYGVPYHCFRDQFQMSSTLARECCIVFDETISHLYTSEYMRLPTLDDIVAINNLHHSVHGFYGMFGSLDCMHTYWKNCPVAWQGSYKGKEKKPSIVLEAICDHHLWFWHGAYGYAGTMNDRSIWAMSPFLSRLIDGTFSNLEKSVVPYKIGGEEFRYMYILVDGIYPRLSRFVHCVKQAIQQKDKVYTACKRVLEKTLNVPLEFYKPNGNVLLDRCTSSL